MFDVLTLRGKPRNIAMKPFDADSDLDSLHIQTVIKEFLGERFDIAADRITDDTSIRDVGLDSMMMLEVMLELEDRLGLKLKDLSLPVNPTLRDVVALVERNQAQTR